MSKNFKIYLTVLIAVLFYTSSAQTTWNVKQDGTGDFTTIQAAINAAAAGDIIMIGPGLYDEESMPTGSGFIQITKSLTILGASHNVSKEYFVVPANYDYITAGLNETVLQPTTMKQENRYVMSISAYVKNVTVKGLVFQITNASHLVGNGFNIDGGNDNIIFENNVVGPILNIADAPYSYTGNATGAGRGGIRSTHKNGKGVTNASVRYNTFCDDKGNSSLIYFYGQTENSSAFNPETRTYASPATDQADYTNFYVEHNHIYGARQSGIEFCAGVKGVRVGYNRFHDIGPNLPEGDVNYNHLKFGNAINFRNASSMYYSQNPKAGAFDIEIYNNEFYNLSKNAILCCPLVQNIKIYNNYFHDIKGSAVYVDLKNQFWIDWPDPSVGYRPVGYTDLLGCTNAIENIQVFENKIIDCGEEMDNLSLNVVGAPTNGFIMNAEKNYFGGNAGTVSANIDIFPYYLTDLTDASFPINAVPPYFADLSEEGGYQAGNGNWYDNFGDAMNNTDEGGTILSLGKDVVLENMIVDKNIIIDGDLNIHPGASLTVLPGVTLTIKGNLNILANNKYGVGSVIEYGNIVLSEGKKMTAQLFISGGAGPVYHYVSPIIADASKNLFSGTPSIYAYTEALVTGSNNGIGWTAAPASLVVGQGYAVQYNDDATITYTGPYNHGNFDVNPLTFTTNTCIPAHKGWNLIGNPYPSSIDVDQITTWTSVNAGVYYYKASAQNYVYYLRNTGASSNGGTNIILPGQGFFVQTRTGASPAIQFNDGIRTHNVTTEYYKKDNNKNNSLSLVLSNGAFSDEAVVAFKADATANFDGDFDAFKMFSPVANIYTLSVDGELAINTMAEYKSVPVVAKADVSGNYNLTFKGLDSFNKNISIYLEDTKTSAMYDLRSTSSVKLALNSNPSNFVLHFNNAVNGLADKTGINSNIYSFDNYIYINNTADNAKVEVYNLLGELVVAQNLSNALNKININGTGYYLIKVSTDSNTSTQKVFIK